MTTASKSAVMDHLHRNGALPIDASRPLFLHELGLHAVVIVEQNKVSVPEGFIDSSTKLVANVNPPKADAITAEAIGARIGRMETLLNRSGRWDEIEQEQIDDGRLRAISLPSHHDFASYPVDWAPEDGIEAPSS